MNAIEKIQALSTDELKLVKHEMERVLSEPVVNQELKLGYRVALNLICVEIDKRNSSMN